MKALRCLRHAGVDELAQVLEVQDVEDPTPGHDEVVVDVHVAGVNFTDLLFVSAGYQVPVPVPFTPGSEFSGVVAAIGPGVSTVRPGDRVTGQVMSGAFAEQVVLAATAVRRVPDGVDLVTAAATGVAYGTAYSALRSAAVVRAAEWVAITGAAGGVGSAAVVLARELGAHVLAVVSTPAKAAFCRRLRADAVLDLSTTADVKGEVRRLTDGGADVVLDLVGGGLAEPMLRGMRRGGRFVTLGYASGAIPRIPLNLLLLKEVTALGFEIRRFAEHHPSLAARDAAELAALHERGLMANVSARYPLKQAPEALRALADRSAVGKVVLTLTTAG
ncbi:NADPH:quinone oxidoreductase family protein [uncultured Modestobacter sp.]|uniref:NADPH:quinone oxidoreductase family protein n=1 Tax=uncultured Modestobacter sp. TaxID=380048 RepID=UPI00261BE1CE|nr:NADPH:quinone oxidoreductase family protein [uncultured Modestobacter sp.]